MCAAATQSNQPTAKDARFNHIYVGDTVIYPSRRGSSLTMTEGTVESIINENQVRVRREREAINFGGDGFTVVTERLVTVGTQQMVRL